MFNLWRSPKGPSHAEYQAAQQALLEQAPIPVLWLFGKTGSGKSSIIRYLTGVDDVEIGTGYQPQTQFSSLYAFPDADDPILKFLDTRGLGEAHYDPQEDIAQFNDLAHLMIVTVRAMDHSLDELVTSLRKIRKSSPQRPVILALTALHDAYPGQQHPEIDPFRNAAIPVEDTIPESLRRSLHLQLQRFEGLFDTAVPLDLTPEYEGFHEPDLGGDRLKQAILDSLPAAYRQTLLQLQTVLEPQDDLQRKKTISTILGMSSLAATAAAVPFPWVDIPVVMGVQTHLIYKLARLHGQSIDTRTIAKISGVLGSRVAVRMALKEGLKFIPWIGIAANATAAFAMTYATGMAWNWYFTEIEKGRVPNESELREVFQNQFRRATELWTSTHSGDS